MHAANLTSIQPLSGNLQEYFSQNFDSVPSCTQFLTVQVVISPDLFKKRTNTMPKRSVAFDELQKCRTQRFGTTNKRPRRNCTIISIFEDHEKKYPVVQQQFPVWVPQVEPTSATAPWLSCGISLRWTHDGWHSSVVVLLIGVNWVWHASDAKHRAEMYKLHVNKPAFSGFGF
jgi:hypothetical protein